MLWVKWLYHLAPSTSSNCSYVRENSKSRAEVASKAKQSASPRSLARSCLGGSREKEEGEEEFEAPQQSVDNAAGGSEVAHHVAD